MELQIPHATNHYTCTKNAMYVISSPFFSQLEYEYSSVYYICFDSNSKTKYLKLLMRSEEL